MKIRLSFSGAQKLLAILSFLLAAGYFVYLAMAWSGLEERIVIYWRVPLSMHIEIAYRWYLLLPPILFLLESLLIWRLSSLRVSHDPPSLSDSIRMDGLQCCCRGFSGCSPTTLSTARKSAGGSRFSPFSCLSCGLCCAVCCAAVSCAGCGTGWRARPIYTKYRKVLL